MAMRWKKKKKNENKKIQIQKQKQGQTFCAHVLPILIWELEVASANLAEEISLVIIGKRKGAGQPERAVVRKRKWKRKEQEGELSYMA